MHIYEQSPQTLYMESYHTHLNLSSLTHLTAPCLIHAILGVFKLNHTQPNSSRSAESLSNGVCLKSHACVGCSVMQFVVAVSQDAL